MRYLNKVENKEKPKRVNVAKNEMICCPMCHTYQHTYRTGGKCPKCGGKLYEN